MESFSGADMVAEERTDRRERELTSRPVQALLLYLTLGFWDSLSSISCGPSHKLTSHTIRMVNLQSQNYIPLC